MWFVAESYGKLATLTDDNEFPSGKKKKSVTWSQKMPITLVRFYISLDWYQIRKTLSGIFEAIKESLSQSSVLKLNQFFVLCELMTNWSVSELSNGTISSTHHESSYSWFLVVRNTVGNYVYWRWELLQHFNCFIVIIMIVVYSFIVLKTCKQILSWFSKWLYDDYSIF